VPQAELEAAARHDWFEGQIVAEFARQSLEADPDYGGQRG
jgi:hypothetical protein